MLLGACSTHSVGAATSDARLEDAAFDLTATRSDLQAGDEPADAAPSDQQTRDAHRLDAGRLDASSADGASADAGRLDAGSADAAPSMPVRKVVFAHGPASSYLTLASINTDGSNYQTIPGFGRLAFDGLILRGQVIPAWDVTNDQPASPLRLYYQPVLLPHRLGTLISYWERNALDVFDQIGFLLVRPDGRVDRLYTTRTFGSKQQIPLQDIFDSMSVSKDGRFTATARAKHDEIVLLRTDGSTFANGKSFFEARLPQPADELLPASLTFAGSMLYFISRTGNQRTLWRMPRDGSHAPTIVKLAKVGGAQVSWIGEQIEATNSGLIVVAASAPSSGDDLIAVDSSGARNLTNAPATIDVRGDTVGASYTTRLRLSPSGKRVAFTRRLSAAFRELWVTDSSGTASPLHVTNANNVGPSSLREIRHLVWIDDDTLVFVMGETEVRADLFRFNAATATLTRITGTNPPTKPYLLAGTGNYFGLWLSPNRRYLFYIDPPRHLYALDLSNWTARAITPSAASDLIYDSITHCAGSSSMVVAAKPSVQNPGQSQQLFLFDQDQPAPATQVTQITDRGMTLAGTSVSADCGYVVTSVGWSIRAQEIYAGRITTPNTVSMVTNALKSVSDNYTGDNLLISSDHSVAVFAMGTSQRTMQIYAAPLAFSAPARLAFPTRAVQNILAIE